MKHRLGQTFLYAGTAVCVLGGIGLTLGMFVTIPDALAWKIARAIAYAAPLLVGGTLMTCGALFIRAARRDRREPPRSLPGAPTAAALAAPALGTRRDGSPSAASPSDAVEAGPHGRG